MFFYHTPNMNLSIPARGLGTRLTTIFIIQSSFYHLNKHIYPNSNNKMNSIIARNCKGQHIPITTPIENARIDRPIAFEASHLHKLILQLIIKIPPTFTIYYVKGRGVVNKIYALFSISSNMSSHVISLSTSITER